MADTSAHQAPARVTELVEACLADLDVDVDAVELLGGGAKRVLRIVIDADAGVPIDLITQVSRELSGALDRSEVMGAQAYTLEVTSRGIGRPLTQPRHWHRNAGRLVKATHTDGSRMRGRIAAADDDGVTLDDGTRWAYADLASAVIEPELNTPKER